MKHIYCMDLLCVGAKMSKLYVGGSNIDCKYSMFFADGECTKIAAVVSVNP